MLQQTKRQICVRAPRQILEQLDAEELCCLSRLAHRGISQTRLGGLANELHTLAWSGVVDSIYLFYDMWKKKLLRCHRLVNYSLSSTPEPETFVFPRRIYIPVCLRVGPIAVHSPEGIGPHKTRGLSLAG